MLIVEMSELGQIAGDRAAALAGHSGQMRGRRIIGGGRASRCALYRAALAASHHNADLKIVADRLRDKGKPHKVVTAAVVRRLLATANVMCRSRRHWTAQTV